MRRGGEASSGDNKIDDVGWLKHDDMKDDLAGIFAEHPGLKDFVESVIKDFKSRNCEYKVNTNPTWWYEVICQQGNPKGRQKPY
ncbi:hypothetical protein MHLP_04185 [Candidatus Mycoplasma haematolamae str. Purdue]|uniref:Uncharacterized protein n=1 Tax=Mycoplasma haematolamae (strain Purdue) TaxID=1212765 RepID=I7C775_MYCHA|nr:hypothetical protein [Candidatus Mycoplasma haematolamae]AFO52417.1 hypothetical protein MHLP_04185 [Candidatus Mycoplasma haematolamae str. Purdue]